MTPLALYHDRLKSRELQPDPVQEEAAKALDVLHAQIMEAHNAPPKNWFERVTGLAKRPDDAPKGLYFHGGVGRGKSMIMDLFYSCLPDDVRKRRVHFHEFMIELHDYQHARREDADICEGMDGILPLFAERIAEHARILCFDEFHVTDVADAMILGRLFTALFDRDVIVVATSNWPPERLYEGGLQRERFLPFIDLLKTRLHVFELDNGTDYRSLNEIDEHTRYFYPLGTGAQARMDALFTQMSANTPPHEEYLDIKGRRLRIPLVAQGIARMSFSALCEQPHGPEDYLKLAEKYEALFLEDVPKMGYDRRNEAKRFMTLIDALYEAETALVVSADAPPDKLYYGHDHAFEFERTTSRLNELCGG